MRENYKRLDRERSPWIKKSLKELRERKTIPRILGKYSKAGGEIKRNIIYIERNSSIQQRGMKMKIILEIEAMHMDGYYNCVIIGGIVFELICVTQSIGNRRRGILFSLKTR